MGHQKKLTIAIACDPIDDDTAGVIVSTLRFARGLRARGHRVIFLAARSRSHHETSDENGIKIYRFPSVPLPKSDGRWNISFPSTGRIKSILRTEQVDVVHITLPLPSAISALRAARALGIATVAHSHSQPENVFLHLPWFLPPHIFDRPYYAYMAWVYNHAHRVIAVSPLGKDLLIRAGVPETKIEVISNGVDISRFRVIDPGDFRERMGIPSDAVVMLFVGRLQPEKSIETLIRATALLAPRFPKLFVLIIGGGNLKDELEALSRNLKVDTRVIFAGRLSESQLVPAYNASDIFVLPSLAELEGMVVLEAMACGTPVVAYARGAVPEIVKDGITGFLVNPSNDDIRGDWTITQTGQKGITEAVKRIYAMEEEDYETMRGNCRKLVEKKFDINTMVDDYYRLFLDISGH